MVALVDIDYNLVSSYTSNPARFMLWLSVTGNRPDDLSELASLTDVEDETFMGEYSNPADYAMETATNSYLEEIENLPTWISNCIDWNTVWHRELQHDYYTLDKSNGYTLIWATI